MRYNEAYRYEPVSNALSQFCTIH